MKSLANALYQWNISPTQAVGGKEKKSIPTEAGQSRESEKRRKKNREEKI